MKNKNNNAHTEANFCNTQKSLAHDSAECCGNKLKDFEGDSAECCGNKLKDFEGDSAECCGNKLKNSAQKSGACCCKKLSNFKEGGSADLHEKRLKCWFFIRVFLSAILLALGASLQLRGEWNLIFYIPAYIIIGFDVAYGGLKNIFQGKLFDERFLMLIASVGAFLVGSAPEGVLVMILYQIGEFLTDISVERSKKSISALTKLRAEFAVVVRDGVEAMVDPETVAIGEIILIKAGERVPLDGVIKVGKTSLDMSALTGESVPVDKAQGAEVLAGAVNLSGLIEVEVTKPFGASAVMRILQLTAEATEKKTKTELFIKKFAKFYTPAVVFLAVLVAIIPPLATGASWFRWVHAALMFLVISCPCALVISVPLTYFAGVGSASKQGILVKGGAVFDALKKVKTVVFDKTGTLTEGVFQVTQVYPAEGVPLAHLAQIVAAAEGASNHPIAKSIVAHFGASPATLLQYTELSGLGISATIGGQKVLCGNQKLMQIEGISTPNFADSGSVVYVAEGDKFLGAIVVSDKIKPGAEAAVCELNSLGIATYMLTGDRTAVAEDVANALHLKGYRAELMPQDKVCAVEEFLKNSPTAFVGDGVNDAPSITRADVGFAMGGIGQDAAIEAADIVIMDDNLSKIAKSIKIGRKTSRIAMQNIVFALAVKAIVMVLGVVLITNMWLAVFADVGVTLLAVANAMRAYYISKK